MKSELDSASIEDTYKIDDKTHIRVARLEIIEK